MTDAAATPAAGSAPADPGARRSSVDLEKKAHPATTWAFLGLLAAGVAYAAWSLVRDTHNVGEPLAMGAFAFLGLALLIALGFEFVNGFHDTANAVATVIYTHSMPPLFAVVWSGFFNFLGVVVSSGTVAYSIISLLPVDLILNVGSAAGYAMIFALLLAAVVWNLGTWWLGLPNSSSHALIGSILGVGLANQLMNKAGDATSGVEWGQATDVIKALLFSPLIGFAGAALVLLAFKALIKNPKLFEEPEAGKPPPWGIRSLLVFTCTAVSFAHGGNDGQKGMGLIMLILIGVAPTAYALNRTMPDSATPHFLESTQAAQKVFAAHAKDKPEPSVQDAGKVAAGGLQHHALDKPEIYAALNVLSADIARQVKTYGSVSHTPAGATHNLRNQMYVVGDAVHQLTKNKDKAKTLFPGDEGKAMKAYGESLNSGTRYIPTWVKVTVAIALGLGTMVGWKRIVVTVGERIGKTHLTYAMGASAELMAAVTIGAAQLKGLPVSTTHILSSGVAGAMAANGSGLQWSTVRNIAMAWVLTLPAAMALAAGLYWLFRQFTGGLG